MSSTVPPSPTNSTESLGPPGQPPRRLRGVDLALLIACAFTVTVSMLVSTGVVATGLFAPSPLQWTVQESPCSVTNFPTPIIQHTFPLWATVHVHWSATGGIAYYAVYNSGPGPPSPLFQGVASGNGSFRSNAYPYTFQVGPFVSTYESRCSHIAVTTTVTYTI